MLHFRHRLPLLIAALLLLQVLTVAHAFEHPVHAPAGDIHCAVCAHGHDSGHAPPTAAEIPQPGHVAQADVSAAPCPQQRHRPQRPHSRAPPHSPRT